MGGSDMAMLIGMLLFQIAPFVVIPVGLYIAFSRSPLGKAMIDRWRRDVEEIPPLVEQELDRLHGEITELQERLDFTERMLAEVKNDRHLFPLQPEASTPTPASPDPLA